VKSKLPRQAGAGLVVSNFNKPSLVGYAFIDPAPGPTHAKRVRTVTIANTVLGKVESVVSVSSASGCLFANIKLYRVEGLENYFASGSG
jgi:hypothetical protein